LIANVASAGTIFGALLEARDFDALFGEVITPAVGPHEERKRLVARVWRQLDAVLKLVGAVLDPPHPHCGAAS
jgi:hypothetical protein